MPSDTIQFEPGDIVDEHGRPCADFEEGATFTVDKNRNLIVSVAEERAVDSYNRIFECTIHMSPAQAACLRDWLAEHFPK